MKLISWNVNGLRAVLKKPDLLQLIESEQPDVLCLQETKAREEQVTLPPEMEGYASHWNAAEKPGYSSTAIFSKTSPIEAWNGMGAPEHDSEGRVITLEYEDFFVVTVYTPNSQNELRRLPYRVEWDAHFLSYVTELESRKPVVFCGDLNVSHREIDLARPGPNRNNPGFSDAERKGFDNILAAGFVDTFRHFEPNTEGAYSWWSYRAGARGKNIGWRLDYFCISGALLPRLSSAAILDQVMGSDHCPVLIELD
ncbi:MAG: exodeoxyribonuclease III [Planctomycetota bacterium]